MDLFALRGIVLELESKIASSAVGKIFQLNRTDLLLRLRTLRGEKRLLLSTHPDFYRLHLTEKKYANPLVPPRFCMYLRKHITGARVAGIIQAPYERVVRFHLEKRMDAGLSRTLFLVVELVGRWSNVLLLDAGDRILDCLHFRREEDGAVRPALPGLSYRPPPFTGRRPPEEVTPEKAAEIALLPPGERWKGLVEKVLGIGPLLAQEIEYLSGGRPEDIRRHMGNFWERYRAGRFEPRIVHLPGGRKILSPFPLAGPGFLAQEPQASMNEAADSYYFERVQQHLLAEHKSVLGRRLRQLLTRLERRREHLLQDRERFETDRGWRERGEILVANFPKLRKGLKEIELTDFSGRPVVIPLEERLDAAGNVERCFNRYKKAKRGLEAVAKRLEATEREIAYLDSVTFQAEEATDGEELSLIRGELEKERILPPPRESGRAREREEVSRPYRRFRSSAGREIFCGKHNLGNEYLLRQLARGNDLWFHAQGVPGSHVVLRAGAGGAEFESIREAAIIAAFFSRGRGSGRVPVDYTEVKNLHRPKGARPGMVTYSRQKTIFVQPEKEKVEKLALP